MITILALLSISVSLTEHLAAWERGLSELKGPAGFICRRIARKTSSGQHHDGPMPASKEGKRRTKQKCIWRTVGRTVRQLHSPKCGGIGGVSYSATPHLEPITSTDGSTLRLHTPKLMTAGHHPHSHLAATSRSSSPIGFWPQPSHQSPCLYPPPPVSSPHSSQTL